MRYPLRTLLIGLAALAVLIMGSVYVVGYFRLSRISASSKAIEVRRRNFKEDWQVTIYTPAVQVESFVLGIETIAVKDPRP